MAATHRPSCHFNWPHFPLAASPWCSFATQRMSAPYVLPEQWSEDLKDENGEPLSKRFVQPTPLGGRFSLRTRKENLSLHAYRTVASSRGAKRPTALRRRRPRRR